MKNLLLISLLSLPTCSFYTTTDDNLTLQQECDLSLKKDSIQCQIANANPNDISEIGKSVNMGMFYLLQANMTPENCKKANYWLDKGINISNPVPEALNAKGMAYSFGCGVEKDYRKAADYYIRAEQLHAKNAKVNLSSLYKEGGYGLPQDYEKAIYWARLGFDEEPARASNELSQIYIALNDEKQAKEYLQKAAELGNAEAQYNLGYMYDKGMLNNSIDKQKAKYWYEKSASQGFENAKINLKYL